MGKLTDKVVVVTGAQQGIGKAIALAMAAEGAHIVINWLDDADAAASCALNLVAPAPLLLSPPTL